MGRLVKDKDYLETVEGLFFCVVGYLHPPGKYTAYLKYVPSASGRIWRRGSVKYERIIKRYHVVQVGESFKLLEERYPHYLHYCPIRGIRMSMVPREYVKRHYAPEDRLREILASGGGDPLERDVASLASWIAREAGVDPRDMGVTGSTLLGIHNPALSDIDLVVYGAENMRRVEEFVRGALLDPRSPVKPLSEDYLRRWSVEHARDAGISPRELLEIARRRWNYGVYRGRYFSIHAVRKDCEVRERYGDRVYRSLGEVEGRATISDSSESLFLPALYRVEDVAVKHGEDVGEILEIVSFEGIFSGVLYEGERVRFRGKLEEVVDKRGHRYYRVVVGSLEVPQSYVVPLLPR